MIFILAGPVVAGGPLKGSPSPFGNIQTQLDELAAQVKALQDQAPDTSVEGRTYCFVLDLTIMRGRSFNGTEELQRNIIRRTAVFSGGMFTAPLLSNVLNNQLDDGTVNVGLGTPFELLASYSQTGGKLDMIFPDGSTANWYVSNDGSVIHGSNISHGVFGFGGMLTVGFVRNWTLVENDSCDMEGA